MNTPRKILVIRNDKIGDFMLAWPSFALLKKQYPDAQIIALVPEYTAALARHCEWIDDVIIDDREKSFVSSTLELARLIRQREFDLSVSLFSEARTAIALWLSGINCRVGPATKIAQLFLNRTLKQKRSQSLKPEYEYNLDLARHAIRLFGDTPPEIVPPPYLHYSPDEIQSLKKSCIKEYKIPADAKIIVIHPGSGGSAINLTVGQYAELARGIASLSNAYFFITAGPGEAAIAYKLSDLIQDIPHHIHLSMGSIIHFCKFLSFADMFIGGSTGPLHIAGALDINTAAFYPAKRSATSLRWKTLNSTEKQLAFSPDNHIDDNDMESINITKSAKIISEFLNNQNS